MRDGTRLRLTPRHGAPQAIRDAILGWAGEDGERATAVWHNTTAKPLTWGADGMKYSPTGLANHIFTSVTGRTADGIQGTTWWDVDTRHVPEGVDPDEWAALAGASLADLAKQLGGARRDWSGLHALLATVPAGRWTTYGDVAAVIGSHAVPVGRHLATCGRCPHAWRVLTASGRVSKGFRWSDGTRAETPLAVLTAEGLRFDGETAEPGARLSAEELRGLLDG
ncbi:MULTISPECIES: hypothetical protein [unclassified Streptomyces]|uniref:hypothetical protein n=1 Tax=unclassified Streptomyces TaxID=2593676 RepID=UPI0037F3F5E7